ncbi:hypothetical protein A5725_04750 [Mycobacterium kubicae]|uniref:hypothetical protein n=1 Tax=Mycobacterium kubicae TaxID=120959 RepID=UPI0007FED117|nr:hypothetical protein [Mycobacterium kubicae]OBF15497.1 hypothetical protein A5725_04750 [Mycobacterium kubicae]
MNKTKLLAFGAEIALIATTVLYLAFHELWISILSVVLGGATVVIISRTGRGERSLPPSERTVGVGTVREVGAEVSHPDAGEPQIWVEVCSVHGDTFIGRLVRDDSDPAVATLRPGSVVLVAFNPEEPEQLSLPDDVLAVRASGLVFA